MVRAHALTGLTILPGFVLAVGNRARWRWPLANRSRTIEAVTLAMALIGTITLAFLVPPVGRWHVALHFYAPLPALIWAALRFGPGGASAALTATTLAAIWGADRSTGPFRTSGIDVDVFALQLFVLLTTIPVLCIAAISTSRQRIVQLHRALLASVQDHIAILDGSGVVVEVNDGWLRFAERGDLASSRTAAVGDNYVAACRSAAEAGDSFAARVFDGVNGVLDGRNKRFEMEFEDDRNGRHDRYAPSIEPLARLAGGAIVRRYDVTARHRAQMESEEQRRQLSHLARVTMLGQLSGALAHELNQPLAAIASNADAAQRLLGRHPTDYEELDAILSDIITANHRASQVIRRLRAMLKRGEARLQPLDTAELVGEVLDLAHAELITRRVTATAVVAPNLPPVLGDRVQLQQVLLNLVLNACEAMASTPPPERRLSMIVTADAIRNVQFSVRDSGTGIPANLIDRLFEPFVTTKPEGLGLGLSISRTIVAAHGGRLWAQNNGDCGATVHCLLPSALVERDTSGTVGERIGSTRDALARMKVGPANAPMLIAIIDDEESVRTGLRRLCVSLGLRASVYASGSEFLDSLAAGAAPPNCLLLDAHMPHMSGLEVQRHLVDAGLKIPTIVYTADDAPEAEARYVAAGVTAYLRKPIAGDELLAAIEQVNTRAHPTAVDQRPSAVPPP